MTFNEKIQSQKAPVTDSYPGQESMYDGGARAFNALGAGASKPGDPDASKRGGNASNSGDVKAPGAAG